MRDNKRLFGRKVVVKTWRKCGNGAIGSGRKGQTGKRGIVYQLDRHGKQTELTRHDAPTFKELSKKLFGTGLIPRNISIKSSGETVF